MRQALGIARTVFEPEDPMYLGFLSDLATVLVKRADDQLGRGQYESAQRLLWERRAFEAMAYGDLDWRTTDARLDWSDANRLARLEPDQRRLFAESMAMLKRSEESSRRGEFRDAVDGAEVALRGLEATLGRGNRRCLRIVDRLGVLLARQGDLAGAESVLRRSTEAHRLALGEEHPDYAATLINLSRVYSIQGDDARAEPLARRAMAILETAVGDRSPLTMAAMDSLIVVRRELSKRAEASGDFAKAQQFREEILALTIRRFGETAPEVTAAKAALGRLDKIQPGDGKSQPKSP